MFRVIVNENPPPPMSAFDNGYNIGFGRGTMDCCSGTPPRPLDKVAETDYNNGYIAGYIDAYATNEVNRG